MRSSSELRALAREQLKGRYWMVFVASLIVSAVTGASYPVIIGLVIVGPLMVGFSYYLLDVVETNSKADKFELLFEGFKNSLVTSVVAHLLIMVFVFLWSLLFIIPGIIKGLGYSMTRYIIVENPNIEAMDAIAKSQEMMRGHKGRLFWLYLSFIGWFILSAFTLGIGLFFLIPYIQVTVANFYVDLRGRKVITADFSEE